MLSRKAQREKKRSARSRRSEKFRLLRLKREEVERGGTAAAKEDGSGTAAQAGLSMSESPHSKNYGQSIQRKRKRRSSSGPNSSRTPIVPFQPQLEVSVQGDRDGVCLQALPGSPHEGEYATELSMSPGKVMKVGESPCAVQSCERACTTDADCNKLTSHMSFVSDSTEHCCSKSDSKSMQEVTVKVPDHLLNTSNLLKGYGKPPRVEPNECFCTDSPPQCAGFTASSASAIDSLANHTTFHQPPSPAGLGSMTIEDSFHMGKKSGPQISSSAPIPDQEAGVESGQTIEDVPCQCSIKPKSHGLRNDDVHCSTIETQEDDLLDELFGIQQVNPSAKDDIAEELLCGLCPEDLDSTLNTSMYLDAAKDDGCPSPWYHKSVRSPILAESQVMQGMTLSSSTPHSMVAKANVQLPTKQQHCAPDVLDLEAQSAGMRVEGANLGGCGSAAVIPGSELRHTRGATSTLDATGDGVQQVRERGEGGGTGERGGGGGGRGLDTLHCYPADTFYGLPLEVQACIKEHKGIMKLYDWQDTCLRLPSVASGCNLIYSLPTSGGKTLVAEILILQQLLLRGRDVLFVLPFVSIVQEKVREMLPFASALGFAVEEYAASKGKLPPRKRRKKKVVYIATIEKANGLVNSLIELQRIGSVGLVVVDELHMIGDGGMRGATLETCLAKMLYCSAGTQVVGMSATLSNIQDLAKFLRAEIYSSDFRPVDLREYVKLGRCVYSVTVERGNVNFHPVRNIQDMNAQLDRDQLCSLVMEVIPQSSCLFFCPTKKGCQNVATLLATGLPRSLREVKSEARHNLLKLLSIEAAGVCPVLARTVPYGIAYHHSGLTADERRIIEEAYLEGTLCLLVCTSTLAAGVNLPAKRVILRSPYIGRQFLTRSQYKQMIGRAGRAGLSEVGESILLLKHQEREKVVDLLSGPYDRCSSTLLTGGVSAMLSLILTLIGLKLVRTSHDLILFFQSTLLYVQHDSANLALQCQDNVSRLVAMGYITMENSTSSDNCSLMITPLGNATYKGCLQVEQAHIIYQDLVRAQQCLVLSTDLHLLHISTPPDLTSTITPNWMVYFETLTRLCPDDLKVAQLVGVSPGIVAKKATGTAGKMSDSSLSLYHRFYITLMLYSLLRAGSAHAVWVVAECFQCSRGFLQNIINSTAAFASCLVHFTEELPELWSLHLLFPVIGKRLAFSASIELAPLMEISGVKQGRAMQLLAAGYHTPQDIAAADPSTLSEQIEHLFPKNAKRLIHAAKVLLADQAEALYEEAEELMSLVPPQ